MAVDLVALPVGGDLTGSFGEFLVWRITGSATPFAVPGVWLGE
ncbi:hypothetical protein Kfla_0848 [Kribbella flavida DSM 17836]|uniref:Uncharacterized protein n=1 Tax=Kribbella flavida (strain DSM 17836 / JCM 10339 / NBRC 14399) TaxID=479435 RepID=D2PZV6_KRIFD|nr:hypothetical protein Kfla_0848 [Kribbella flavida DSM 17836]